MNCESEHAAVGAMFDAFCKEVLRNTIFNYKRKLKRQSSREVITPDPEQYISARDAVFDVYTLARFLGVGANSTAASDIRLQRRISVLPIKVPNPEKAQKVWAFCIEKVLTSSIIS